MNELTGELLRGRCKATNICDPCARLGAIENTEMLTLDALHGVAPNLYGLLTTRTATLDTSRFYKAHERITERWRHEFGPQVQVARLLEFTTGRGIRSGGQRRPHWNLTCKGIEDAAREDALAIMRQTWCTYVDALPDHQDLQPIRHAGGLMRYIALHFQKESQKPPKGFSGHRFTKTRGYLWLPTTQARDAARDSLRRKRIRWHIEQDAPDLDPETVEEATDALSLKDAALSFRVVQTLPQKDPRRRPMVRRDFGRPDGWLTYDPSTQTLVPKGHS
jgi:hypothetical protein